MGERSRITDLLSKAAEGNETARQQLFSATYDELHQLARRLMQNERANHTLQATALVNEASMKLLNSSTPLPTGSRALFFWAVARAMRQVLVNHARKRQAQRRGGQLQPRPYDESMDAMVSELQSQHRLDLLELEDALAELETINARQARIVDLRFFGELAMQEIAEQLDVSLSTVEKEWRVARVFLSRRMMDGKSHA